MPRSDCNRAEERLSQNDLFSALPLLSHVHRHCVHIVTVCAVRQRASQGRKEKAIETEKEKGRGRHAHEHDI